MTLSALESRMLELCQLKAEYEQRFRLAQDESSRHNAERSIWVLEGGIQDCQYWAAILATSQSDPVPLVNRSGFLVTGPVPKSAIQFANPGL